MPELPPVPPRDEPISLKDVIAEAGMVTLRSGRSVSGYALSLHHSLVASGVEFGREHGHYTMRSGSAAVSLCLWPILARFADDLAAIVDDGLDAEKH